MHRYFLTFDMVISFPLDAHLEGGLLDHMVILYHSATREALIFSFLATRISSWDLSSQPGIVSGPMAVKALSLNCWTTKELLGGTNYGFGINRDKLLYLLQSMSSEWVRGLQYLQCRAQ